MFLKGVSSRLFVPGSAFFEFADIYIFMYRLPFSFAAIAHYISMKNEKRRKYMDKPTVLLESLFL